MPPRKQKQPATAHSNDAPVPSFAPPATYVPTGPSHNEPSRTPQQSPRKQAPAGITQTQKQALVDNLQLEVTERARKLRAQYASQAQSLRSRLEMRVNRIPSALRKKSVQELIEEHRAKEEPPMAAQAIGAQKSKETEETQGGTVRYKPTRKSLKRTSDQISTNDDKENNPAPANDTLDNPKKRAKPGPAAPPSHTANTKATRTGSRVANTKATAQSTVLSPRSANSRTLPRSPFKSLGGANEKPPTSPSKPAQGRLSTRPGSRQQQTKSGPGAAQPKTQDDSEMSNLSAGTTIVSKGGAAPKGKAATVGKAAGAKVAPKKTAAAAKKDTAAAAAGAATVGAGGRSLRKRA